MPVEEIVGELAEEVATNLEEVADATRSIDASAVAYFIGGVAVGAAIGFFLGYRYNREKIKAEALKEADAEINRMRETYLQKAVAAEQKPSVEEIIQEKGYSPSPLSREDAPGPGNLEKLVMEAQRPLPPPVPTRESEPEATPRVIESGQRKRHEDTWDYSVEIPKRTPDEPYVIHEDEYQEEDRGYSQMVYTYFMIDDVMVDVEDNRPILGSGDVVGRENLKWGHGTSDPDVVFVRNDELERDMMITRVNLSYEEEVLGLSNDNDNSN